MALSSSQQLTRWGLAFVVFAVAIWFLGSVLTPYLIAMALAYFLDPLADRLEKRGLSRLLSVTTIMLCSVLVFVVFITTLGPVIGAQLSHLMDNIPSVVDGLRSIIVNKFPKLDLGATGLLLRFQEAAQTVGATLANALLASTKTVFGVVAMFVVVPVVTFYMLLDWDNLFAKIDSWLPRDHRPAIRQVMSEIDKTLAGFIRGQGTICLIMACYYAIALWITGLNFGIVIGIIAGLLTFIPFIGAFIGIALVIGFGLFQFWGIDGQAFNLAGLAIVLGVYFIGQSLEGYYLTPKLVGKSVGLHPIWIMFSLSAFGSIMGLTGMLIGVPVAASIAVVGRYFLGRYQKGRLFLGHDYYYLEGQDGDHSDKKDDKKDGKKGGKKEGGDQGE